MQVGQASGAAAQVVVSGAQVRLAELAVGQLYRVTVTDVLPGKVEILIGNQYLLAATALKFQSGDMLTLRLLEHSPQLLRFQLALPLASGAGEAAAETELATLARAASLPDSPANRELLALLVRAGITLTSRSLGEIGQLMAALPQATIELFLPLYRKLLERNLRPEAGVLARLAMLSGEEPALAGMLAAAVAGEPGTARTRSGRRKVLADALQRALSPLPDGADAADEMRNVLRLLYGTAEREMHQALASATDAEGGAEGAERELRVVLHDLANLAASVADDEQFAELITTLEALRLRAALDPAHLQLQLPQLLDGMPTEVQLSLALLGQDYYMKEYALRLRAENALQGKVEVQARARGPLLNIDVHVADAALLALYQAELPRLAEELRADGFIVRRCEAGVQSL